VRLCKDKWDCPGRLRDNPDPSVHQSDRAIAKRAFDAMMTMKKINIAQSSGDTC